MHNAKILLSIWDSPLPINLGFVSDYSLISVSFNQITENKNSSVKGIIF